MNILDVSRSELSQQVSNSSYFPIFEWWINLWSTYCTLFHSRTIVLDNGDLFTAMELATRMDSILWSIYKNTFQLEGLTFSCQHIQDAIILAQSKHSRHLETWRYRSTPPHRLVWSSNFPAFFTTYPKSKEDVCGHLRRMQTSALMVTIQTDSPEMACDVLSLMTITHIASPRTVTVPLDNLWSLSYVIWEFGQWFGLDKSVDIAVMNYPIPKIGQARPRVSYVDVEPRRHISPRLLNYGLSFVPMISRTPFRTPNELAACLLRATDASVEDVALICERVSSARRKAVKPALARGLTEQDIADLRSFGTQVVIKPADKGGRVVVMSRKFYVNKVQSLLNNPSDYLEITDYSALETCVDNVDRCLRWMLNIPSRHTASIAKLLSDLTLTEVRIGLFYGLPKIHKSATDPPLRPVVSQVNHPTAGLARWIDAMLQSRLYANNPQLLRSTEHATSVFDRIEVQSGYFLSLDVKSLYTSIPLISGIKVVKGYCESWGYSTEEVKLIVKGLTCVLFNNYFEFGERTFRQTKGVAMGSPLGPAFANTFMLSIDHEIMSFPGVLHYFRYIDDILVVCDVACDLEDILRRVNNIDEDIKLEYVEHGQCVDYLDMSLLLNNGSIVRTIYEKDISSASRYIDSKSLHRTSMLTGVAVGAFIRTSRLCTKIPSALHYIEHALTPRLREQGLTLKKIRESLIRALTPNRKCKVTRNVLRYVYTISTSSHEEERIIKGFVSKHRKRNRDLQMVAKNYCSTGNLVVKAKLTRGDED